MGYNIQAGDQVQADDLEQVYRASGPYAASSAGSDAYAITVTPAPDTLEAGMVFRFKADVANAGACTLNVNSKGAKTIKKMVSGGLSNLDDNDIRADAFVSVIYDGTDMIIIGGLTQRTLGSAASKSWNTVYQADTDGFVVAFFTGDSGSGATVELLSDSSNPPTTRVGYFRPAAAGYAGTMMAPVKKGDYYKANTVGNSPSGTTVYFWPLTP